MRKNLLTWLLLLALPACLEGNGEGYPGEAIDTGLVGYVLDCTSLDEQTRFTLSLQESGDQEYAYGLYTEDGSIRGGLALSGYAEDEIEWVGEGLEFVYFLEDQTSELVLAPEEETVALSCTEGNDFDLIKFE